MAKVDRSSWTLVGVPSNVERSKTGRPVSPKFSKDAKNEKLETRTKYVMVSEDKDAKTATFVAIKEYKTLDLKTAQELAGKNEKKHAVLLCKGINANQADKAKKSDAQFARAAKILAEQRSISDDEARKLLGPAFGR